MTTSDAEIEWPDCCMRHIHRPKPVARTSEFVATIHSLSSTTVQPQVEGILTRVLVRSGDR